MTPDRRGAGTGAGRLQDLFVRLLFCDITYERYRADALGLAREFGIDIAALAALPDADAPQLLAERRGRKFGVMGEVEKVFRQSYGLIESLPEFGFEEFLCADAFFDDASGLPHPYGVGPGYENASKFYFWARETLTLTGSPDRLNARLVMNGDFAAYLIDQYGRGAEEYYRRFANGVYWRESPDAGLPVILMTVERHVFRIDDQERYESVVTAGTVNLDSLMPEPPRHAPNIL